VSDSPIWVKSSFSAGQGQCVEVAALPDGGRAVRDSKNTAGPALRFSAAAWRELIATIKAG
jgi:hypothetical protein